MSLGLSEQKKKTRPALCIQGVTFLLWTERHCVTIAMFVWVRLAIHEQHIVMSLAAGDVFNRGLPASM